MRLAGRRPLLTTGLGTSLGGTVHESQGGQGSLGVIPYWTERVGCRMVEIDRRHHDKETVYDNRNPHRDLSYSL